MIGAGVSGAIATKTLEEHRFSSIILEATNCIDGYINPDYLISEYSL
ncbi:hypothetical protein [Kordia zhangzhouensis]